MIVEEPKVMMIIKAYYKRTIVTFPSHIDTTHTPLIQLISSVCIHDGCAAFLIYVPQIWISFPTPSYSHKVKILGKH